MCHEGFAENQQLFFPYFALWEQPCHFSTAEQLDFLHLLPGGGPGSGTFEVPQVKIAGQEDSARLGQKLKAREYPMGFDGEPVIRGLDEMVGGNTLRFLGHFLLVLEAEKVLDDRVGKGNIKSFVRKRRQVCGITYNAGHIG